MGPGIKLRLEPFLLCEPSGLLCEAMGVALPGNGTVLAMTPERIAMVKVAAKRIVEMTLDKNSERWNMRNILNEKAIHNAFVIDMAIKEIFG